MRLSRVALLPLGAAAAVNALTFRFSRSGSDAAHSRSAPAGLPSSWFLSRPHPVVVWHGLGDSTQSDGMQAFAQALREAYPGIFVHLIALADSAAADQRATLFGQVNDQVAQVCEQLASIPELQVGFDAIGFSQGGQFMRAYVERCNDPPVRNLVTFGSQHQGIAGLPECAPADLLCRAASGVLRNGVNTDYAQSHIVTAQYYRNPRNLNEYQGYLDHNHFLIDINNEVQHNSVYKRRLASVNNFIMVLFSEDQTVVPPESGWFSTYPVAESDEPTEAPLIPLRESTIYQDDLIGLKALDRRGALVMDTCQGSHMVIDAACQTKILGRWIGSPKSDAAELLWRPASYVFSQLGIHGGSWLGPLRWPKYTWVITSDGSRRLQIEPARFGSLSPSDEPMPFPQLTIDFNTVEMIGLMIFVIVLFLLLWKVLLVVLLALLSVVLFPGLIVGAILVLPLLITVFLVSCVLYLPFAIIAALIRRATAPRRIVLPSDHPAWDRLGQTYGSFATRTYHVPAGDAPSQYPYLHSAPQPQALSRPGDSSTRVQDVDVEALPPSYDDVLSSTPSPSRPRK